MVFLQYLYEKRRPFRIVPLVVGSFQDSIEAGSQPSFRPDVGRMIEALRKVEAETAESVCYIISGDLAHIGPKFGDKKRAAGSWLTASQEKDTAILKTLEAADPSGFFETIAAEENARRICGLSPTWLTLEVTKPRTGTVLHYQQYVHPQGTESVSFAAVAFRS